MKRFTNFHTTIYLMTAVVMLCAELGFAQTDWIKEPGNPVLDRGPSDWDSLHVFAPSVILDNGIYKMWYAGQKSSIPIGYATSEDGIKRKGFSRICLIQLQRTRNLMCLCSVAKDIL